jgi:hypothetical protein
MHDETSPSNLARRTERAAGQINLIILYETTPDHRLRKPQTSRIRAEPLDLILIDDAVALFLSITRTGNDTPHEHL